MSVKQKKQPNKSNIYSFLDKPYYGWYFVVKYCLSKHIFPVSTFKGKWIVSTRYLLTYTLNSLGGDPDNKNHQNIVADILKTLGWERVGKKPYHGERLIVFAKCHTPKMKEQMPENTAVAITQITATPLRTKKNKTKVKSATPPIAIPSKVKDTNNFDNAIAVGSSTKNKTSYIATTKNQQTLLSLVDFNGDAIKLNYEVELSGDESSILPWEILSIMAINCPMLEHHYTARIVDIGKTLVDNEVKVFVDIQWANYQRFRCFPCIYDEQNTNVSFQVKELIKVHSQQN